MDLKELIDLPNVYQTQDNQLWTKYTIPSGMLSSKENMMGDYLISFKKQDDLITWIKIYEAVIRKLSTISDIDSCLEIIPLKQFDEYSIQQKRPFNEGYTTKSYAEFLEYGSCRPNEWIIESLTELHTRMLDLYTFDEDDINEIEFENHEAIILNIIHRTFLKPTFELVWGGDEQWLMYLPCIEIKHINDWKNYNKENKEL